MHWIWCIVFDENQKTNRKTDSSAFVWCTVTEHHYTHTTYMHAYLVYTIGLNRICAHASGPFAHGHPVSSCIQCRWFLFYIGKLCRCCIQTCIASHWFGLFSTDIYDTLQILSILKHKPLITQRFTHSAMKGDRATQFHCILILIQIRFCLLQAKRDVQCIFGLAWSRTLLVYAPAVARIKYLEQFLQTIFFLFFYFLFIYVPAVCV